MKFVTQSRQKKIQSNCRWRCLWRRRSHCWASRWSWIRRRAVRSRPKRKSQSRWPLRAFLIRIAMTRSRRCPPSVGCGCGILAGTRPLPPGPIPSGKPNRALSMPRRSLRSNWGIWQLWLEWIYDFVLISLNFREFIKKATLFFALPF